MSTTHITTGRRKAAVARVYMTRGKGNITVNNKEHGKYFPVVNLRLKVEEPFNLLELKDTFDVKVNVAGGGVKGQAEAVRLGIARALCLENEEYRPALKKAGMLTRDPRVVERKKPGLRKARKKEQYSKR